MYVRNPLVRDTSQRLALGARAEPLSLWDGELRGRGRGREVCRVIADPRVASGESILYPRKRGGGSWPTGDAAALLVERIGDELIGICIVDVEGDELFYWNDGAMMAVRYVTDGESFTPGQPTVLFKGDFRRRHQLFARLRRLPDGKRFMMIVPADPSGDPPPLILFTNWFDELERLAPVRK